ncbi:MAG: hydantoinase B/oxoprolinase family protein, partial [Planctomycetota bacterium]
MDAAAPPRSPTPTWCWAASSPTGSPSSRERFEALAQAMGSTPETVAAGAFRIAVSEMAEAIKQVTTARGIDPRTHALCAFGGAAGQHACAVAEALGIEKVLLHPLGSVLSAWGIAGAAREETGVLAVGDRLTAGSFTQALEGVSAMAAALGGDMAQPATAFSLDLRTPGTESTLNIQVEAGAGVDPARRAFASAHRALFGFGPAAGSAIELVNARVRVTDARTPAQELQQEMWPAGIHGPPHPVAEVEFSGQRAPVWRRSSLKPGMRLPGPGLVVDELTTVVIDAGWGGSVSSEGTIHLSRAQGFDERTDAATTACDPILLEIFQNRFMSIAEQMGHTLQRTAHSTNIKERLDFSCALFDGEGSLVANAPHIPVHLGAMGESVRAIVAARGDAMEAGDAFVTNDSPVFIGGTREFFVACRGHHADVGGVVPGSMPPDATSIDQEGVRIHDLLGVRSGELLEDAVAAAFGSGPHPARDIPERISDLRAQLAANAVGVRLLQELCGEVGSEVVAAYMGHAQDDAAAAMREALQGIEDGVRTFTDHLDDGSPISISISISGGTALVDFDGTGPAHPGNLNAPRAVVMAAVLYSFRTLIDVDRPMPLNAGIFRPITLKVPEGSLLDPPDTAAVSGGNVETAQRLVDVLLGALGSCAASQGTMNNLTFGDDHHAHYETIAGGAGAGPSWDGASAVHTHMTNTRTTDPEVLERRHPV